MGSILMRRGVANRLATDLALTCAQGRLGINHCFYRADDRRNRLNRLPDPLCIRRGFPPKGQRLAEAVAITPPLLFRSVKSVKSEKGCNSGGLLPTDLAPTLPTLPVVPVGLRGSAPGNLPSCRVKKARPRRMASGPDSWPGPADHQSAGIATQSTGFAWFGARKPQTRTVKRTALHMEMSYGT